MTPWENPHGLDPALALPSRYIHVIQFVVQLESSLEY